MKKFSLIVCTLFLTVVVIQGCMFQTVGPEIQDYNPKTIEEKPKAVPTEEVPNFPETVGDYKLVESSDNKDCDDLDEVGYPGEELCQEGFRLRYEDDENNIMFILPTRVSISKQRYHEILESVYPIEPEIVEGGTIYRMESHEFLWYTDNYFDVIVTQEGRAIRREDGVSYSYGEADSNNPVLRRFLKEFPPSE